VKKVVITSIVALVAVSVAVTAAFAAGNKSAAAAKACVLLPDTKSSVRWQTQDAPTFKASFKKAGISATVVNAEGDAQRMISQADQ
jgi:D-xylose transport system substrate-binding protein